MQFHFLACIKSLQARKPHKLVTFAPKSGLGLLRGLVGHAIGSQIPGSAKKMDKTAGKKGFLQICMENRIVVHLMFFVFGCQWQNA